MTPLITGILAMVAAIGLAIFGATLFQYGWAGILGALLIVGASILFAIGAMWTRRKTWADKSWPPSRAMDPAKALRFMRRAAVTRLYLGSLLIVGSITLMALGQSMWPGAMLLIFGVWELIFGVMLLRSMKHPPKDDFWTP